MPRASLILLVALLLCCWSEEDQWQWATTPTTSVAPRHSSTPLSGFAAAAPLQNPAESVAPQPQDAERESAKYEPKNKKTNQKNKSKKKKKDKKLQGKGKEEASGNFQQQQQQQQQQRPSQGSGSGSGGSRSQQLERAASQFKQLWVRAVALNDVRTLSLLLERRQQTVPFDTEDCGDPTRTCLHTALAGYHSALQSGKGFAGDAESTGQFSADQAHGIRAGGAVNSRNPLLQTLSLLTDHAGLNAAHFCPVVDAVHFRLVDGIHFLVDRMSPHEIAEYVRLAAPVVVIFGRADLCRELFVVLLVRVVFFGGWQVSWRKGLFRSKLVSCAGKLNGIRLRAVVFGASLPVPERCSPPGD